MSEGGLDMKLNEQASNLSGGQRQRLALARALMHDRNIYILTLLRTSTYAHLSLPDKQQ